MCVCVCACLSVCLRPAEEGWVRGEGGQRLLQLIHVTGWGLAALGRLQSICR